VQSSKMNACIPHEPFFTGASIMVIELPWKPILLFHFKLPISI